MLQSEELRASLLARYPPEKLFQAERNFNAAQDLDVSLLEGDVVGVIKQKDPMGSPNRWLIDNGGKNVGRQITVTLNEEAIWTVPESCLGQEKIWESLIQGKIFLKVLFVSGEFNSQVITETKPIFVFLFVCFL